MLEQNNRRQWPGATKAEPREIATSAAAPGPVERELEAVDFNDKRDEVDLATSLGEGDESWSVEGKADLENGAVDGWVAGMPIVRGLGAVTSNGRNGFRVRMAVIVQENRAQVEWVKGRVFGGAEGEGEVEV